MIVAGDDGIRVIKTHRDRQTYPKTSRTKKLEQERDSHTATTRIENWILEMMGGMVGMRAIVPSGWRLIEMRKRSKGQSDSFL